jgi:predicted small secreted protein
MVNFFKMIKTLLSGVALTIILAGCQNTVQGFGKDMEHSGQKIQKSVSSNKI